MQVFKEDADTPGNRGTSEEDLRKPSKFIKIAKAMKLDDEKSGSDVTDYEEVKTKFMDSGAERAFGSQLPPPPACYDGEMLVSLRAKAKQLCGQELNYLMTVGRIAKTSNIILCCATLLLD